MIAAIRIDVWLVRAWWLIFPCFAALTAALVVERTCAQPYQLLPSVTSNPALAWPLALLYLCAYLWAIAVYLLTVQRSQSLLPSVQAARTVWPKQMPKVFLMLALLVVESSPVSLWHLVGAAICGRIH